MNAINECDVAIIGMSCRLPGANNLRDFWLNLIRGVESIQAIQDDEILQAGVPLAYLNRPNYVKAAPVLDGPGEFDAAFFGYSPEEARTMDPQHRILLELAQEALEHAGCNPDLFPGPIGVFAGSAMNTYFMHGTLGRRFAEEYIPILILNDKDFLSTRISYKLNLKGPSINVQTACSTSLVAIHLARQSLLSGEVDAALAGAISVRVPHRAGYFSDGGVTSTDGHVRAFDGQATGTVFGSGGGVVVMKRLADAVASGDTIYAVIKGTAVNNDGCEKAGYTAPSVARQADVVVEALGNAGVEAGELSYVEAHGSGTPLGDPIEIAALTRAFRSFTPRSGFCGIGSVKTNIGHLDVAAGMAGLIKTVLALKHRQIPPTLHYREPNPEIDFSSSPFFVNSRLSDWSADVPRLAGVMSTGMGGTNAFVVLEEAPDIQKSPRSEEPNLLLLSARTENALELAKNRLAEFVGTSIPIDMGDVAFTLQVGRRHFSYRDYVVCSDQDDAITKLQNKRSRGVSLRLDEPTPPIVFLLSGVGDQYIGMGYGLYEHFPTYRDAIDRCAKILDSFVGLDIRQVLYPQKVRGRERVKEQRIDLRKMLRKGEENSDIEPWLNTTVLSHAALFSTEYALACLWKHLGVTPNALVGHSLGEYVAATLAEVFTLQDAIRLIARRAQLVDQLAPGCLLAVNLPEFDLVTLLNGDLSIALINGPSLCVVAGSSSCISAFEKELDSRNVIFRRVQNSHAFHSPLLTPIVREFENEIQCVRLNEPVTPFISNMTGTWISHAQATDPAYWSTHAIKPARFHDGLHAMWKLGKPTIIEVGPGRTLGALATQHPANHSGRTQRAISSLRHDYENDDDMQILLDGIGALWLRGVNIQWDRLYKQSRCRIPLPTYPFERQDYWFDEITATAAKPGPSSTKTELDLAHWFYVPSWKRAPFSAEASTGRISSAAIWVIFTSGDGLEESFATLLQQSGARLQVVHLGQDPFHQGRDGSIGIDASNAREYVAMFRHLRAEAPINIVHLGCVGVDGPPERLAEVGKIKGFYSLMYIAQALGELNFSRPVKLGIVSRGLHDVAGDDAQNPEMAAALGLAAVMPKEFPNISWFNVDLPPQHMTPAEDSVTAKKLLSEFVGPAAGDIFAYRGKYRWSQFYEPVSLPTPSTAMANGGRRLRPHGVYLITGGTGGLGLTIAKFLARTCQATIVLTRKTSFPDKYMWKDLRRTASRSEVPDKTYRILAEIAEIEALGSEVEVAVADVGDSFAMQTVISGILKKFKSLHGVIHAAGTLRPGLIQAKHFESVESVLWPKVQGTRVLYNLLKDIKPDFLVLFSSQATITGPLAHSDYSAANSVLDSFSHFSNSAAGAFHTVTINWPAWKDIGMLPELKAMLHVEDWKDEVIQQAIESQDGVEAFARILNSEFHQVVVSTQDLHEVVKESRKSIDSLSSGAKVRRQRTAKEIAAGVASTVDPPTDELERTVSEIWADVFGFADIGIHESFASLGGHSLLAMQIVGKLRTAFQISLTLRDLFETATIAKLSARVHQQLITEIENLSDREAQELASNDRDA